MILLYATKHKFLLPQYFFVILQNDNYKQSEYGRNGLDPQAAMPPNQSNSKTPKQSLQARPALR